MMNKNKNEKFCGISVAEISIPTTSLDVKKEYIQNILKQQIRNGGDIWERTICYLLCNAEEDGKVEADTPTIYNAIFSEHEIALHSHLAANEAMKEINSVKHWLYQRQILAGSKGGDRFVTAKISVFRNNRSVYSDADSIIVMCDQNATKFSIDYLECVSIVRLDRSGCGPQIIRSLTEDGIKNRSEGGYLFHLRKYNGRYPANKVDRMNSDLISAVNRGWIINNGSTLYLNGQFYVYEYEAESLYYVVFKPAMASDENNMEPAQKEFVKKNANEYLIKKVKRLCENAELDPVSKVHVEARLRHTLAHFGDRYPESEIEAKVVEFLHGQIIHTRRDDPNLPYIMLLHDLLLNDLDQNK